MPLLLWFHADSILFLYKINNNYTGKSEYGIKTGIFDLLLSDSAKSKVAMEKALFQRNLYKLVGPHGFEPR